MSVWLTPELKPFYGGTYFPLRRNGADRIRRHPAGNRTRVESRSRQGRRVGRCADGAAAIARARGGAVWTVPGSEALDRAVRQFKEAFDPRFGGFGAAPKFHGPRSCCPAAGARATGDGEARDMVLRTLRAMALGGMRDHIGGGFHRYSVDGAWRVPHFEKMLYDQAQLTTAFLEAAQVSGDPFYAEVAEDTLLYVMREMTDSAGGFHSAEDADSVPPEARAGQAVRRVGRRRRRARSTCGATTSSTRCWVGCRDRQAAVRDRARGQCAARSAAGIRREEPAVRRPIHRRHREDDAEVERSGGRSAHRARLKMFEARLGRPRPHRDDKVLTA